MTTIKDLLTENRESVISSIKYMFKIWKAEDVKVKMIEFLAYAEKYGDVEMLKNSKKVKTDLKELVAHMKMSESFDKKDNRKWYEIAEDIADKKGLYWNSLTGEFEKI